MFACFEGGGGSGGYETERREEGRGEGCDGCEFGEEEEGVDVCRLGCAEGCEVGGTSEEGEGGGG